MVHGWSAGSALSSAVAGEGQLSCSYDLGSSLSCRGVRRYVSPAHAPIWQMKGEARSPMLLFSRQLILVPVNRVSSAVLPRGGTSTTFLSVVTGKGKAQLPLQLRVVGMRELSIFPLFLVLHCRQGNRTSYAPLLPLGLIHLCPCLQGQLYCHTQARCRAHFPECFSW